MDCYLKAKDPKELVLKLLGRVFSEEELACSNFNGGEVHCGRERLRKTDCALKLPTSSSKGVFPLPSSRASYKQPSMAEGPHMN